MSREIEDLDEYNQFLQGIFHNQTVKNSTTQWFLTIFRPKNYILAHDNLIVIAFFGSHVEIWKKMAPLYEEMAAKYNKTLFLTVSTLNLDFSLQGASKSDENVKTYTTTQSDFERPQQFQLLIEYDFLGSKITEIDLFFEPVWNFCLAAVSDCYKW